MQMTKQIAALVVAGVCAAGTAGCGTDGGGGEAFKGESADAVAEKAVKATRDADSLRMKGQVRESGGQQMSVDLAVDSQKNCEGSVTQSGATAEIRHTKATLYVKGDEKYWQANLKGQPGAEKIVPKVADKWVKIPAQDDQLTGLCDKQGLLAAMDEDKSERKGMTKGETADVDGNEALKLTKKSGGKTLAMYVATHGEPYILKVTSEGGDKPEGTTFGDFDEKVNPEQPAASETVDLQELAGANQQ